MMSLPERNGQRVGAQHEVTTERKNSFSSFHKQPIKKVVIYDSLSPEQQKALEEEYYEAYDINDGIRTATALGGFITLFVVFLIYKTKCKAKKKYFSTSEGLPFDDIASKDGRTSQDVSNVFSNTSSLKGSNVVLHSFQDSLASPQSLSHPPRTPNFSQSSYEGNAESSLAQVFDFGASSSADFRIVSPTDGGAKCQRKTSTAVMLQEANINIQVIQPTPNITPRGSIRLDSPDSNGDEPNNFQMIIPLLSPNKSSRRFSESPLANIPQHRVSFDRQSVESDCKFFENICELSDVKRPRRTDSSKLSSALRKKSSEETSF